MKISLRSRIYLAILPLLLLFLSMMFYLILDIRGLYRDSQEITFTNIDIERNLNQIGYALERMELILDNGEIPLMERDRDLKSLDRLSSQFDRSSKELNTSLLKRKLDKLAVDLKEYGSGLNQITELVGAITENADTSPELLDVVRQSKERTTQLKEAVRGLLKETKASIEERAQTLYIVMIGGMLLAIALTLFISTLLWRRILIPIEEISERMNQFSSESEPLVIQYEKNDELGRLARDLENMTRRLADYQLLTNRKLIRSTGALRSILEHSPDAFFILSDDLTPVYTNPRATGLLENSALADGFPKEIESAFRETLDKRKAVLSSEINQAVRLSVDEQEKWFLVHAFHFEAPEPDDFDYTNGNSAPRLAAIFQDVTLLKLSDSLRKNLLATVSHELKTPITSAQMSLYLLLEEQLGPINGKQKELLETARDDLNRQLSTIGHLLDISRIEENLGQLEPSTFTARELAEECLRAHKELAAIFGVELSMSSAPDTIEVTADRARIHIVLNNFIINGIKYSGRGKHVSLAISESDQGCRFEVNDDGPGMDPETADQVFDAYTRGNGTFPIKGNGLGLKISKDIIEAHGGRIGCTSKLGEGSSFFFEIPHSPEGKRA